MAVLIGSARSDENGKAHGGKAGDQTGREVSTQNWYKHKKGWRVLRAKNALIAKYIASAMKNACSNNKIGYDQYQNQTLWDIAKSVGYDPSKVSKATETDCARLIRLCVKYACVMSGIDIEIPDFYTANLVSRLLSTGLFIELKGSKYTCQSDFLGMGDICCTSVKGHGVAVLTNGSKYDGEVIETEFVDTDELGKRILKEGKTGEDVALMQKYLIDLGYDLGKYGSDGDFGECTEIAVMAFQKDHGCKPVDGEYGPITHEALMQAINELNKADDGKMVCIEDGQCWIRTAPNTSGKKLAVAKRGTKWPFGGAIADNGWLMIEYENQNAWVSDEYGVLKGA